MTGEDGSHGTTEDEVKEEARRTRPDLASERGRLAFIKVLNSRLPRKRHIAQGLVRDEQGRVLLCQLVYKQDWDLPGGVVDPEESPASCVVREVREELGLEVEVRGLLAVNWLPPYRGWDDALLTLFDLGTLPAARTAEATLQPREIRAVHWVAPEDVAEHVAPYTARMLRSVLARDGTGTLYLEDGTPAGT